MAWKQGWTEDGKEGVPDAKHVLAQMRKVVVNGARS